MAGSSIDLCNLALAHLGDSANISDFTEGSAQADYCARFYPVALDALLAAHDWGFATRRADLALLSDDTGNAWTYSYALPNGCIKAIAVLAPDAEDTDGQPFEVESDDNGTVILYTDIEDATLRFIYRVTDTTKFTPLFGLALARLLASQLAGPIIKGAEGMKVSAGQYKVFMAELAAATAADARARHTAQHHTPSSISARGGSYARDPYLADGRIIR